MLELRFASTEQQGEIPPTTCFPSLSLTNIFTPFVSSCKFKYSFFIRVEYVEFTRPIFSRDSALHVSLQIYGLKILSTVLTQYLWLNPAT